MYNTLFMKSTFCFSGKIRLILLCTVLCTTFQGCKKDPDLKFAKFTGTWEPVSFYSMRAWKPSNTGETGELKDGKLLYTGWGLSNTETLEFHHKVSTSLKDGSTLLIMENYKGYNDKGELVKEYNYGREIQLEEGRSHYGTSGYYSTYITPERLELKSVNYGSDRTDEFRVLKKIE